MNQPKNILYLSYDGMTDPLGQSQVLPYIVGLTKQGYSFTLLSCEKQERFDKNKKTIQAICNANNIDWQPIMYTKRPPVISTVWDIYKLNKRAKELHKQKHFQLFHCRSYITALIGLGFKQKKGVKFLFDMRGFWADERIDGGIWNKNKFPYKQIYRFFKQKETDFLSESDAVVSLTETGKQEMLTWNIKNLTEDKITVIPCATDYTVFKFEDKKENRKKLNIPLDTKVISYVGSLGTWYLADEMIRFFAQLKKVYPNSLFLFLTPEPPKIVYDLAKKHGLKKDDFKITFCERKDLPKVASVADYSLFFIKPAYSKMSSSPTKMGELLAMGIPVICNDIGDVKKIIETTKTGICIDNFDEKTFLKVINALNKLDNLSKEEIRENSKSYFLLEKGLNSYLNIYKSINEN